MLINKKNFLLCKRVEDSLSLLARGFPIVLNGYLVFSAEFFDEGISQFLLNSEVEKYNLIITRRKANFLNIKSNSDYINLLCDKNEISKILNENESYQFLIDNESIISHNLMDGVISLMKIGKFLPIAVIHKLPDDINFHEIFKELNIPDLSISDIFGYCDLKDDAQYLEEVSRSKIALCHAKNSEIRVFRDALFFGRSHVAIIIGEINESKIPLVRIHSGCYTGDLLNSLQCDCHDQLHLSIQHMNKIYCEEGRYGVIVYQAVDEGRAIGLANKIRAYKFQQESLDTIEANHAVGYEQDERNFTTAVNIIKKLGIGVCELITNNTEKIEFLKKNGIDVVNRVFIEIDSNLYNNRYLETKREVMGHLN